MTGRPRLDDHGGNPPSDHESSGGRRWLHAFGSEQVAWLELWLIILSFVVLSFVVSENLENWLKGRHRSAQPVPGCVEEVPRGYLDRGILCCGFARDRRTFQPAFTVRMLRSTFGMLGMNALPGTAWASRDPSRLTASGERARRSSSQRAVHSR